MKQPQSTMSTACACAAVIGLTYSGVIVIDAFSSPATRPFPLTAPQSAFNIGPLSSPRLLPLRSTIEDETSAEALSNNSTETNFAASLGDDTLSAKSQLQQVLSSPELIDPAAVLDATIGIIVPEDGTDVIVVDSITSSGDEHLLPASVVMDDLAEDVEAKELTRLAILQNEADADFMEAILEEEVGDLNGSTVLFETPESSKISSSNTNSPAPSEQKQNQSSSLAKNTPSVRTILRYTIPAIGVWLCSPILSMIDTAAVGLLSGTAQQAAESSREHFRLWSAARGVHVYGHY